MFIKFPVLCVKPELCSYQCKNFIRSRVPICLFICFIYPLVSWRINYEISRRTLTWLNRFLILYLFYKLLNMLFINKVKWIHYKIINYILLTHHSSLYTIYTEPKRYSQVVQRSSRVLHRARNTRLGDGRGELPLKGLILMDSIWAKELIQDITARTIFEQNLKKSVNRGAKIHRIFTYINHFKSSFGVHLTLPLVLGLGKLVISLCCCLSSAQVMYDTRYVLLAFSLCRLHNSPNFTSSN